MSIELDKVISTLEESLLALEDIADKTSDFNLAHAIREHLYPLHYSLNKLGIAIYETKEDTLDKTLYGK